MIAYKTLREYEAESLKDPKTLKRIEALKGKRMRYSLLFVHFSDAWRDVAKDQKGNLASVAFNNFRTQFPEALTDEEYSAEDSSDELAGEGEQCNILFISYFPVGVFF